MNMKRIFFLCLSVLFAVGIKAESVQQKKVDRETFEWRYEIMPAVGQGVTGTELVRVWTYSKKAQLAEGQAAKNAIHGILFKGYPETRSASGNIAGRAPMIADPAIEAQYEDYFYEFFKKGGLYQRYVTYIGNGQPDKVEKVGKEYKIGITVVVQVDNLKKRLQDDGIIKAVDQILDGSMPRVMVMPSRAWMQQHGYMTSSQQLGKTAYNPDYEGALLKDPNLRIAISKMNELLVKRGFDVKDFNAALQDYNTEAATDAVRMSKTGAEIAETAEDKLMKVAGADIRVEIQYTLSTQQGGSKTQMQFTMEGIDAYTQKPIATQTSPSSLQNTSNVNMPIMIESAVVGQMENFSKMLITHFEKLQRDGREITVIIEAWDDFEDGLYAEFDGEELHEIIYDWIADNTVKGKFNRGKTSDNYMRFENVHIPMKNEKGRDIDAMSWLRNLQKKLRKEYDVDSKVTSVGMGNVVLVIGGK